MATPATSRTRGASARRRRAPSASRRAPSRPRPGSTPRCGPTPTGCAQRAARSCTASSCCAARRRERRAEAGSARRAAPGPPRRSPQGPPARRVAQAIADLPEVEWVGVSAPEQKLSLELGAASARAAAREDRGRGADPDRHQPLRGRRRRQLPPAARGRRRRDRRVRRRPHVLSRGGHRRRHRADRGARLRAVRRADRAHVGRARSEHAADRRRHDPPGHARYGLTRFSGASIPVGIMDSGFEMGAVGHDDLWQARLRPQLHDGARRLLRSARPRHACARDDRGHRERGQPRYRGVAPGVGIVPTGSIRAAKIWDKTNTGLDGWMESAMDWMAVPGECDNRRRPWSSTSAADRRRLLALTGHGFPSRKLDYRSGSTASSTSSPRATRGRARRPSGRPASRRTRSRSATCSTTVPRSATS